MGISLVKFIGEQTAQINAELAKFKRLYNLAKRSRNMEAMAFYSHRIDDWRKMARVMAI